MDTFKQKNLLIISAAPIITVGTEKFLYKPYETEMQIWSKYASTISFCCPIWTEHRELLKSEISFPVQNIIELEDFDITNVSNSIKSLRASFSNCLKLFTAMKAADHIHLRCPGNMGLLGCFVQIAFPSKPKSAKYAGNWDLNSKQPLSYRLQKWILSNKFLTRNIQVLVYGEWPNSSKNIKPFFTASYYKGEIVPLISLDAVATFRFVFAGSLVQGKNPQYAIELIRKLREEIPHLQLDIYGEGILRVELEALIKKYALENSVFLHGNQNAAVLKKAFQESHFVLLPSKSEGWPKVVAEGMFWGCVPIATPVSCVSTMLDHGNRGVLLEMNIEKDVANIKSLIEDQKLYTMKRAAAASWSRTYTLDYFEDEIQQILHS